MLRKLYAKLHLWIGLTGGLIFSLVCLSGAGTAFVDEALKVVNADYLRVPVQTGRAQAPIDTVLARYARDYPLENVFVFNAYREPGRSYDFFSAVATDDTLAGGFPEFAGYKYVYADPYTGDVLKVDEVTLMAVVLCLTMHTTLFLGDWGHWIIKIATVIFLLQVISGLYLWWPAARLGLRSAVARIRRRGTGLGSRSDDLHRVFGFWISLPLVVIIGTGVFMSYESLQAPVVEALGGDAELLGKPPTNPPVQAGATDVSLASLYSDLGREQPDVRQFTFFPPGHDTVTVVAGATTAVPTFLNFETGRVFVYDRYTGRRAGAEEVAALDRNVFVLGQALLIHMGAFGGLTTKIIAFLTGVLGATLPVTGVLIWWRKRRDTGLQDRQRAVRRSARRGDVVLF